MVKHGAVPARVDVRCTPELIEIDAVNAMPVATRALRSARHGLIGVRERAEVYGGTMTAGTTGGGCFHVHVALPIHPTTR